MSEPKDPEQLLADALRAQAVFAPQAERLPPEAPPEPPEKTDEKDEPGVTAEVVTPAPEPASVSSTASTEASGMPPQYGLLSGAGADSLERERAALGDEEAAAEEATVRRPAPASVPLPAHWVLLLALLLGLAAGSVVGLLTLV
ncbi:hypothetical protein [Amycolatopsis sp. H20-H5]|uniref:hypothetical protein n=1 Tax=Amycolatopsis sp. H20-H5 TaxID=3046309 RepID=UPI002DBA8335|nr:hypothetical protein [Amycolatopsis sp. H20-H5]MEC3980557.1 hypothetical protein [Amycolatopsis sp. H20-H5]